MARLNKMQCDARVDSGLDDPDLLKSFWLLCVVTLCVVLLCICILCCVTPVWKNGYF